MHVVVPSSGLAAGGCTTSDQPWAAGTLVTSSFFLPTTLVHQSTSADLKQAAGLLNAKKHDRQCQQRQGIWDQRHVLLP